MKHINDLLTLLGGIRPASRALDIPPSTINNWKKNGIPAKLETLSKIQAELLKLKKKVTLDQLLRLEHD